MKFLLPLQSALAGLLIVPAVTLDDESDGLQQALVDTVRAIEELGIIRERLTSGDASAIGAAIRSTDPDKWPAPRREALSNFIDAVVRTLVDSGEHERLDSWLCAIARMGFDVQPHQLAAVGIGNAPLAIVEQRTLRNLEFPVRVVAEIADGVGVVDMHLLAACRTNILFA